MNLLQTEQGYIKSNVGEQQVGHSRNNGSVGVAGGNGGYTSGEMLLTEGQKLYVYVGGHGTDAVTSQNSAGGYNGGGLGTWDKADNEAAGAGGGATDIRLTAGEWDNFESLKSRIMVAAGGGGGSWSSAGGAGGGLEGLSNNTYLTPGKQDDGYKFGIGQDGYGTGASNGVAGSGGGYYGATTSDKANSGGESGAGGSSFVSGHEGCNAISGDSTQEDIIHTGQPMHYSEKVFSNSVILSGVESMPNYAGTNNMIGNSGNGYAKITFISAEPIPPQDGLEEKFKDNTKIPYVINYPVAIDENGTPEDDWQVFYIEDYEGEDDAQEGNQPDKGRRVFLIASDYVKILDDPDSAIQKSIQKTNFVQNSEDDKKDYGLKLSNIDGVANNFILPNQEGKANIFPKLFEESSYGIWNNQDKVGSRVSAIMLNTDKWSDFKNSTYADYAIGGPTYAMWIHSWNMRHPDKKAYYETNEYGYLLGLVGQDTRSYILEKETDALYFPHGSEIQGDFDQDGIPEYCEAYWGASPCGLYNGANLMRVGGNIGLSDRWPASEGYGIRPIVCLKANVKLTPTENSTGIENAECFKIEF